MRLLLLLPLLLSARQNEGLVIISLAPTLPSRVIVIMVIPLLLLLDRVRG